MEKIRIRDPGQTSRIRNTGYKHLIINGHGGEGAERKTLFRIPDPRVKKASDPGSGSATLDNADKKNISHKHLVVNGRGGEGAETEAELCASAQSVAALHNARHVEGEDEHEGACAVTRVADPHSFHPDPDPAF
jgi:hypothetical protein